MIQNLWVQVGPYFYGLFEDSHYLAHANEGHKRIMAAIREGRPAAVRQSVMDDINEAGASLIPRLRELTN
jgi:DNA-binding GntR family transcriptional regulator